MADRRLDRTAVRKIELGEEGSDVAHWRSRPPGERLAAMTALVLEHHGWTDGDLPRLQSVCRVRKRS